MNDLKLQIFYYMKNGMRFLLLYFATDKFKEKPVCMIKNIAFELSIGGEQKKTGFILTCEKVSVNN